LFGRSFDKSQKIVSLLEKAYAKMYGSYHAIESGNMSTLMPDLLDSSVPLKMATKGKSASYVFQYLTQKHQNGWLLSAGTPSGSDQRLVDGIAQGHAYTITKVLKAPSGEQLIQLQNPWHSGEWTGRFSDESNFWTEELKRQAKHTIANDGLFWMDVEDFIGHFDTVDACSIDPPGMIALTENGSWSRADGTAVGPQGTTSFCNNPQYFVQVNGNEDADCYISLVQDDKPGDLPFVGFYLCASTTEGKLPEGSGMKGLQRAQTSRGGHTEAEYKHSSFLKSRVVTRQYKLPASKIPYVIIPSTSEVGAENGFQIKVYTTSANVKLCNVLVKAQEYECVALNGEWTNETAGGCKNAGNQAERNTQYVLTLPVGHPQDCIVTMNQMNQEDPHSAGFYVQEMPKFGLPFLDLPNVGHPSYPSGSFHTQRRTLRIHEGPTNEERRLVIIPCTFAMGCLGRFKLEVHGSPGIKLERVPTGRVQLAEGSWRGASAAGCQIPQTYQCPQYVLKLPQSFVTEKRKLALFVRSELIHENAAGGRFFEGSEKVDTDNANVIQKGNWAPSSSGVAVCALKKATIAQACNGGVIFQPSMYDAGISGDFEIIAGSAYGASLEGVTLRVPQE